MGLSNAERQAAFRVRRNELAALAKSVDAWVSGVSVYRTDRGGCWLYVTAGRGFEKEHCLLKVSGADYEVLSLLAQRLAVSVDSLVLPIIERIDRKFWFAPVTEPAFPHVLAFRSAKRQAVLSDLARTL